MVGKVNSIADFLNQPAGAGGKSDLEKYSEAIWLPKNAHELVTDAPPLPLHELGISENMSPEQQLGTLFKNMTNLNGRIADAKATRVGLDKLIDEFSPQVTNKEQTVQLSKDAWSKMGADADGFAFSVKTLNSDQDFAALKSKMDKAAQYFDHVDIQRVTDQKTGRDVAIVVVMHDGEFISTDKVNAVLAAERKSAQYGQAVQSLSQQITSAKAPERAAAQDKTGLPSIDFDKLRNEFPARNPPEVNQQAERIAPAPVYLPGQQIPKSNALG